MIGFARISFLVIACRIPLIIGAMHLYVHFSDVMTPEVKTYLDKEILILNNFKNLWDTLGVVSFMMGISYMAVGLLNSYLYMKLPKAHFPPLTPILVMIGFQCCVTYVGYEYEQGFQLWGGLLGVVLLFVLLILKLSYNRRYKTG